MPRPVLHDYYRSSAAYRVRIALNLKGIAYDSRPVSLVDNEQSAPAFRAIAPQGLVPVLEMDGIAIRQSLAIIVYLDQKVPQPALMPPDPAGQAAVRAMALTVACDIHPLNNLRVLRYLTGELGVDEAGKDRWYRHWVSEGLDALEAMAAPTAGDFLYGDAPGLADICLVPQLYNARRFAVPLDAYPNLLRAEKNATALDAFAKAHPDQQDSKG